MYFDNHIDSHRRTACYKKMNILHQVVGGQPGIGKCTLTASLCRTTCYRNMDIDKKICIGRRVFVEQSVTEKLYIEIESL